MFSNATGVWKEQTAIYASADSGEIFGTSVAISGNTVLVRAPDQLDGDGNSGTVDVYVRDAANNWSWQATLPAPGIGGAVALDGDTALIGVPNQDFGSHTGQGAAYIYVRTVTGSDVTWTQQGVLADLSGSTDDNLGEAVALSGDTAIVGANGANDQKGAAYVFVRTGN